VKWRGGIHTQILAWSPWRSREMVAEERGRGSRTTVLVQNILNLFCNTTLYGAVATISTEKHRWRVSFATAINNIVLCITEILIAIIAHNIISNTCRGRDDNNYHTYTRVPMRILQGDDMSPPKQMWNDSNFFWIENNKLFLLMILYYMTYIT